jgi:Tfp pilus assembly protein PilN
VYIRINLLPIDLRPKKQHFLFDVKVILIFVGIIAGLGIAGWYLTLKLQVADQSREFTRLKQEEASLRGLVDLRKEVEQLKVKVAERIGIIKDLTSDSDVRFEMLKHVNGIIPENLWLLNINEMNQADKLAFTIEGMSYTKKDISKFLEGLQRYRQFKTVALESITPSPLEVRDAFQFIVRVELISVKPASPAKDAKPAAKGNEKKAAPAPKAGEKNKTEG